MSKSESQLDERKSEFESRHASIIRYVIDHPNCTKADVIRYMKGRSSINTTHAILLSLINEGKIIKHEKNLQTHLLTINEKNEFNKIYNKLLDFENKIDALVPYANAIRELRIKDKKAHKGAKSKDAVVADMLEMHYQIPIEISIQHMLYLLLLQMTERRLNLEDSEILYRKIVRLFQKMISQHEFMDLKQKLDQIISTRDYEIKQDAKDARYSKEYAKIYEKYHLDFGIWDDFVKLKKDFQAKFLS